MRRAGAWLLAGLALTAAPAGADGPSRERIQAATRSVLARARYQTRLPDAPPPSSAPDTPPAPRPPRPLPGTSSPPATSSGQGLLWWFVATLIGGAMLALLWLGLRGGTPAAVATTTPSAGPAHSGAAAPEPIVVAPDFHPGDAPLERANALARAGRYAEAIHALLLLTLDALVRRRGRALPAAATSRRVLATAELGPAPRAALAALVRAVEWHGFGGRPADVEAFNACAREFTAFRRTCEP